MDETLEKESTDMDEEMAYAQENDAAVEESPVIVEEAPAAQPAKAAVNPLMQKLPLLIGAVAVVVALILGVGMLFGGGSDTKVEKPGNNHEDSSAAEEEATVVWAKIGKEGKAYIILPDGKTIEIDDEVQSAAITKDREHIVVLLEDGTLYITDRNQKEEVEIGEDVFLFHIINDDYFYYYTRDDDDRSFACLVLMEDDSVMELDNLRGVGTAKGGSMVLYGIEDGLYLLHKGEKEGEKISVYSEDDTVFTHVNAVDNGGKLAVWTDVDYYNDISTIYLYENGEKIKLDEIEYIYSSTAAIFSEDQKLLVVANHFSEYLWLKTPGKEVVKVKLDGGFGGSPIYTEDGFLNEQKASSVKGIYVGAKNDDCYNVYYVNMDGNCDRVLSNVRGFNVINGCIIYLDEENTLFWAKLDKDKLKDEMEIEDDVFNFIVPHDGSYVYFFKNVNDEKGTLYCCKLGDQESVKVKTDAYASSLLTSEDGKTVFFYQDVESIQGTSHTKGTLMTWTYDAKELAVVAGDVIVDFTASTISPGVNPNKYVFNVVAMGPMGVANTIVNINRLDPKSFVFAKYSSVEDGSLYVNVMHWNGKEAEKIVSDVRY